MEKASTCSCSARYLRLASVFVALTFTATPTSGLRYVSTGTRLPEEWCPSQPDAHVSVVYKPDFIIYVFCRSAVLKYDVRVGTLIHLLEMPGSTEFDFDYHSEIGNSGDSIYLFGAQPDGMLLSIWWLEPTDAEWTSVEHLPMYEFVYGAQTVWDRLKGVYMLGGSQADEMIWKYDLYSHEMAEAGRLEGPKTRFGAVWVEEAKNLFIFGGFAAGGSVDASSASPEVFKYDPVTENVTWFANLSVGVVDPGVVWTGSAVYLLCGVHGTDAEASRQHNLLRFDVATRETTVEYIEGFEDVECYAPAAVFVEYLNHVYLFGGTINGEQLIAYIDLDESQGTTSTTPAPAETTPSHGQLKLVIVDNVHMRASCGGESSFATSAVYDGDDMAYIFCNDVVYAYSLSEDKFTFNEDLDLAPGRYGYSTTVMVNESKVLYFGTSGYRDLCTSGPLYAGSTVWELSPETKASIVNWTEVTNIPHEWNDGDAIWNGADEVYAIHPNHDIKKLLLPDYTWNESESLPSGFDRFSSVWAPRPGQGLEGVFMFGGSTNQILWFHTETETVSRYGNLPVHVDRPGAVWTGRHVYLTCVGYQPEGPTAADGPFSNLVRYDPVLNKAYVEHVDGWDFKCDSTAAIYSDKLKRVYIFGGEFTIEPHVKYIDVSVLEEAPATTTTTETPAPSAPPSTETEGSTTTTTTASTTTSTTGKPTPSSEAPTTTDVPYSTSSIASTVETEGPGPFPPTTTKPTPTEEPGPSPPPSDCSALDKFGVLYEAEVGENARNPCPGVSNGTATWFCAAGGTFEGENPDYSGCKSQWMEVIKDKIDKIETGGSMNVSYASSLLRDIRNHVREAMTPGNGSGSNAVMYFGHEIKTLYEMGEEILVKVEPNWLSEAEGLTTMTFGIFQQLLMHESPWEELSQRSRAETGTSFLRASDQASLQLGHHFQPWARTGAWRPTGDHGRASSGYRQPFDTFEEFRALSGTEPIDSEPGSSKSERRITFPDQFSSKSNSYIEIPRNWAEYFTDEEYVAFSGFELSRGNAEYLFPPVPAVSASDSPTRQSDGLDGCTAQKILNGPLMSLKLAGGTAANRNNEPQLNFTGEGVRITFQHEVPALGPDRTELRRRLHPGESPKAVLGSGVCMYWDDVNLNWSPDGCHLVSSTPERTVCECSHLTAFAVIMDLHEYVGKSLALDVMTWILCLLSIVCLIVTIAVLLFSRYWKQLLNKHPRNDLTLNLSIALLLVNVFILGTMDKHNLHLSDGPCIASAIGLHYALLCAFAWMALEGVLLSKLVFIDVFASGREHATLERVGAFAIPAVIVAVTCSMSFGRGDHAYGNDAFCSLHGSYLWSFIGVVAVVLIFNAVVLVMSIRKSYLLAENPSRAVVRKAKSASFWIRGAMSLTVIMGLTWISGFLMLIDDQTTANVAAYIFTITSASQGIFIFVFHIASSKKVRSHFRSITFSTKSTTRTGANTTKEASETRSSVAVHEG